MRNPLMIATLCCFLILCQPVLTSQARAQNAASSIPDPLRFYNKYDIVWEVVRRTLSDMQFDIEVEDRGGGRIRTRLLDFTSGSLTATDLVKFCNPPALTDASWNRAHYSVEAVLERLGTKEILFTVHVSVEGLKRDFKGAETWVACPSNGTLERRIYSKVGSKLLGSDFALPQKKGFWDNRPQPVPGQKGEPTPLPKPDRPPPGG